MNLWTNIEERLDDTYSSKSWKHIKKIPSNINFPPPKLGLSKLKRSHFVPLVAVYLVVVWLQCAVCSTKQMEIKIMLSRYCVCFAVNVITGAIGISVVIGIYWATSIGGVASTGNAAIAINC